MISRAMIMLFIISLFTTKVDCITDNFEKKGFESVRQDFGDDFVCNIAKTDGTIVIRQGWVVDFGYEGNVCVVEVRQVMDMNKERSYHSFYMWVNEVP